MTGPASADELRAQLQQIETDLERIRRTAAEIRADVGEAEDPTDRGSLIQAADEQDALAETLAARREDLLGKLAEADQ
jgi:hypothetical protein